MRLKLVTLAAGLLALVAALAEPLTVSVTVSYDAQPGVVTALVQITIAGLANTTYSVEVRGPRGEAVAVREVDTNASGVAVLKLEIPSVYPEGSYTAHVSGGGENATDAFLIEWNATTAPPPADNATTGKGAARAAGNLVRVAAKLSLMVRCRNEILALANATRSQLAPHYQEALNLTATGDSHLANANASLAAGNHTLALRYAHAAIQSYGRALELQEHIADALNVSFAACRAVLAPPKVLPILRNATEGVVRNVTCKWAPDFYPLMTAFNVAERRIDELEKLTSKLGKLTEHDFNLSKTLSNLTSLLTQARELVESGRSLAAACNISGAAHRLAEAKRLIGAASSELAKLGVRKLIKDMGRAGIEVDEAEADELAAGIKRGRVGEKVIRSINKTLERLRRRMGEGARVGESEKLEKAIENIIRISEKLKRSENNILPSIENIIERARDVRDEILRGRGANREGRAKPRADQRRRDSRG